MQSLPFPKEGVWFALSIPRFHVMNSIHESANFREIEEFCTLRIDSYICPPDLLQITPEKDSKSCSYQLLLSELTETKPDLQNCSLRQVQVDGPQRYLLKGSKLVVSSSVSDKLRYYCSNPDLNKVVPVRIGLNLFKTETGCHYETSNLQIRGSNNHSILLSNTNEDKELSIIQGLTQLSSLVDSDLPSGTNLTELKSKLDTYGENVHLTDMTVGQLTRQVDQLDALRMIAEFNPANLDLSKPYHASNWVSAMFWLLICLTIVLVWSIVRHHKWYSEKFLPWLVKHLRCRRNSNRSSGPNITNLRKFESLASILNRVRCVPTVQSAHSERIELMSCTREERFLPTVDSTLSNSNSADLSASNVGNWDLTKSIYGNWQLSALTVGSGSNLVTVYYNPLTGMVIDSAGEILADVPGPPKSILNLYTEVISNSKPTQVTSDGKGFLYHKEFPFIMFSKETKLWWNLRNDSVIPGIPPPTGHTLKVYPLGSENLE
jgi:hypothetical protein